VTDTTTASETVSIGAFSVSKPSALATAAGGTSLTLPDGIKDGFEKVVKIKSYSGAGNVTLTPAHLAEGTLHTITWNAAGGWFRLRWDNSSTTWRLLGSSGVTIN
jgi:hypothetical protein